MKKTSLCTVLISAALISLNTPVPAQAPRAEIVDEEFVEIPLTAAPGFERPAVLSASSLLTPAECSGTAHRVRENVPTDGYMAYLTIDSDYGTFVCAGVEHARQRIHEVYALRTLVEVSRSDVFADGLKRSIEQPIDAVKNIVANPVGTVKAVPKTVGHFFKKVGNSVKAATTSINDRIQERRDGTSEAPFVDTAKDMSKGLARAGKGIIGFDSAKLECAKQLGVDPYADNERLQEEMEKVSWVYFAGGLPLRIGAAAASGGASKVLTGTKLLGLPDEIYTLSPGELNLRNEQAMTAMEVSEALRKALLANPVLSLSLRWSILQSLTTLNGAAGREAVVELASGCATRQQARFLEQSLRMLARRHAGGKNKLKELRVLGRLLAATDQSGALVLPTPVDYVSWTQEVAEFVTRDDLTGLRPVVLLPGGISDLAQKELNARGWSTQTP